MIEDNRHAIEFNRVFWGEVEWTGTLKSIHSNGYGNSLVIEMPQVLVPQPDGSAIQVKNLSISCAMRDPGCAGWSRALVGREVRFRTELLNRTRGYQPVVRVGRSGKERWIDIAAWGAELVGPVSR